MGTTAAVRTRRMPRRGVRLRVLLPFALALAAVIGAAVYASLRPPHASRPSGPGNQGALIWGNGVFANRAELKAWLVEHGRSYRAWAKAHPGALDLLPAAPSKR